MMSLSHHDNVTIHRSDTQRCPRRRRGLTAVESISTTECRNSRTRLQSLKLRLEADQQCLNKVGHGLCLWFEQITEGRKRAERLSEVALEVCPRIETSRSDKAIKKEIDALRKRLQREEPK